MCFVFNNLFLALDPRFRLFKPQCVSATIRFNVEADNDMRALKHSGIGNMFGSEEEIVYFVS